MTQYSIYTEAKPNLGAIVSRRFEGFTILRGTGYYQRQEEQSAVIIILEPFPASNRTQEKVEATCRAIQQENQQSEVIYTVVAVEKHSIYPITGGTYKQYGCRSI